jgi:hypothetical protein
MAARGDGDEYDAADGIADGGPQQKTRIVRGRHALPGKDAAQHIHRAGNAMREMSVLIAVVISQTMTI